MKDDYILLQWNLIYIWHAISVIKSHTVIGGINTSVHITYFKSTVGPSEGVSQRNMEFKLKWENKLW
jgi:hypothetical protein